ncbi:hypothetical protein ACWERI_34185 [Streptomyces collinus]
MRQGGAHPAGPAGEDRDGGRPELPDLTEGERRRVLEERLREQAAIEAEDFVWRREQARAERARRDASRAAAQERAERERQAAAAADAVRQALPCEDCALQRSAGLCEACGFRRRTEAAIVEAGLIAATWSADLDDAGDAAAVAAHGRALLEADIEQARREFLELMELGALDADPVLAASALAFTALQAVEQALPKYRSSALGRLGWTEEAEAEARRAYKTEQNRRWYKHNSHGADAVAAATQAADAARERTAQYLLAARLEQLRERAAPPERGGRARAVDGPAARARRPPAGRRGSDRVSTELSGVDLARQAQVGAREAATKNGGARKEKPKQRTGAVVRRDGREPLGLGSAIKIQCLTERVVCGG